MSDTIYKEVAAIRKRLDDLEKGITQEGVNNDVSKYKSGVDNALVGYQTVLNRTKSDVLAEIASLKKEIIRIEGLIPKQLIDVSAFANGHVPIWRNGSLVSSGKPMLMYGDLQKGILVWNGKTIEAKDNVAADALGLTVPVGHNGSLVYDNGSVTVSSVHETEKRISIDATWFLRKGDFMEYEIETNGQYVSLMMAGSKNHMKDAEGNRFQVDVRYGGSSIPTDVSNDLMLVKTDVGFHDKIIFRIFADKQQRVSGYITVVLRFANISNV